MAGPQCHTGGGGSNFLCLPEDPQYGPYSQFSPTPASQIFGVQYAELDPAISTENNGNQTLYNGDAVCAICCASKGRSTSIMIPARLQCPTGWTKEYSGYLVAECGNCADNRHRSSYVCLDDAPEVRFGGTAADNNWQWLGGAIYTVPTTCGIRPCSTYVSGASLTCVVCTQ